MLTANGVSVRFGKRSLFEDVNLKFNKGCCYGIIGANGAGKTSTLHAISGLVPIKSGEISLNGENVTNIEAHKLVSLGMAHVPEGRRIFTELTVLENLEMGAYTRNDTEQIKEDINHMFTLFPRLAERKKQLAGTMSGGEQQMLAMGRALMSKPEMILLDEPSMGLSPIYVNEIFSLIQMIHDSGVTVLLVEQNANKALMIADRAYVLETGSIALEGDAKQLLEDPKVKAAYLSE